MIGTTLASPRLAGHALDGGAARLAALLVAGVIATALSRTSWLLPVVLPAALGLWVFG